MKNQACCFTGHRNISKSDLPNVLQKTDEYIRKMLNCGVVSFFVGGALGFDTLAAELLFKIRDADAPFIKVILAYPFEGYTNRWRDPQKKKHRMLLPLYDQFVCVSSLPGSASYLERNRYLVDHSRYCICYCNRNWGGTAYTVRYAQQNSLKIHNTSSFDINTL